MKQLVFLFVFGFLVTGCTNINKILKSSDYDYKLQKADSFYAKRKYSTAQTIYEDVFPVMKGTAKFEDLYYKWAFCHYYQKDYLNAENIFKGFVETFPNSPRAEECRFLRAYCFYKQSPKTELDQTNTMKAITYLQSFSLAYPNSSRNKEVADIVDRLKDKLEEKEFKSAHLYFQLGYYRAASTAFTQLINNYPDSDKSDSYKLMVIKSTFEYAKNSIESKQEERYESVLNECADFRDRFPESKLIRDVDKMQELTQNKIKSFKNEQT